MDYIRKKMKMEEEMVKRTSILWAAGLLGLGLVLGIVAGILFSVHPVRAKPLAAGVTSSCIPDRVVSANIRVVAHCPTGYFIDQNTTVYWFAYPTSDSANASRMLSLFETAKATGASVTFYFDTADHSGASYGCQISDCRAIWAATTP
jgi:hypothetical protein